MKTIEKHKESLCNPIKFKEHWFCKSEDNLGIIMYTLSILRLRAMLSPTVISLILTFAAIVSRIQLFNTTAETFPSAALTISFSSGIIILFFYCRTLSNYEKKTNSRLTINLCVILPIILVASKENLISLTQKVSQLISYQERFLIIAIVVIILAIVTINKRIFKPFKSVTAPY